MLIIGVAGITVENAQVLVDPAAIDAAVVIDLAVIEQSIRNDIN